MPSQLIRNSVAELKRLKEEVTEITKQKMISEARQKIEENAKALMEQILQDKADDEENNDFGDNEPKTTEDSVLTTVPVSDDFDIDVAGLTGDNEVTPTVTTSTDDEGNVDIVIDTNPTDDDSEELTSDKVSPQVGIKAIPVQLPTEPTEMPELPNHEDLEEFDMTNASAEEIMEKFCQSTKEGTLAEIEQMSGTSKEKDGDDENSELASILDEAIELAKASKEDKMDESCEDEEKMEENCDVENLSEEEMAELEKRINEDMLDDMNGPAGASTPQGDDKPELEETIAHNNTNGRHKNAKPSEFPVDKMRPGAVNEAKAKAEILATRKALAEAINKLVNENKALKEQVGTLTTLNEGLEGNVGQYRSKFYEAMLLSYKTGHVNKLLMEQTTTKVEKQDILESFLNATSREEVSQLYENFEKKLQKGDKTTLAESKTVANKLSPVFTNEAGSESAKVLNEGLRLDPNVQKMMRIINYKYNG